jgi:hypothetical protein
MFDYDAERIRAVILEITHSYISPESWNWFRPNLNLSPGPAINSVFAVMPRKTGKGMISISETDSQMISQLRPGVSLQGWTTDRLARVCFLMHLDPTDRTAYIKAIENLFLAAEMSELIALYSSLPFLAYPEDWKMRCAEGIRSNIADVLDAIMYQNPYPAKHLDDKAWNQLVMKAFFTEKNINKIYGIDERANQELAVILSDYAHERWAAGRRVNPLLWRPTVNFIDSRILRDLERVLSEGRADETRAAALAIRRSESKEAKELLGKYKDSLPYLVDEELSWDRL